MFCLFISVQHTRKILRLSFWTFFYDYVPSLLERTISTWDQITDLYNQKKDDKWDGLV